MANPKPAPAHQFRPGISGNPGGKRPGMKLVENVIREAAGKHAPECLEFLFQVVRGKVDGIPFNDVGARAKAAIYLIDRAVGKPAQAVHVSGEDGGPIKHQHGIDEFIRKLDELRDRREKTALPYVNGHDGPKS